MFLDIIRRLCNYLFPLNRDKSCPLMEIKRTLEQYKDRLHNIENKNMKRSYSDTILYSRSSYMFYRMNSELNTAIYDIEKLKKQIEHINKNVLEIKNDIRCYKLLNLAL